MRYIYLHEVRQSADTRGPEVETLLIHLPVSENTAASTQSQALNALLFLDGSQAEWIPAPQPDVVAHFLADRL